MAYTITSHVVAPMPIANTDAGLKFGVSSTTSPTPPLQAGMIVTAADPTYGVGEFILLLGVANTAVGSIVTYNATTFQTALAPVGTNKPQPVAIAMSANLASTWGWYQISGLAVAKKTSGLALASNAAVGVLTVGLVAATGTGKEIRGALTAAKATTPTTVQLIINRPHMEGRIT
jgi:hypothetical protein